jgi:hypothetical protein
VVEGGCLLHLRCEVLVKVNTALHSASLHLFNCGFKRFWPLASGLPARRTSSGSFYRSSPVAPRRLPSLTYRSAWPWVGGSDTGILRRPLGRDLRPFTRSNPQAAAGNTAAGSPAQVSAPASAKSAACPVAIVWRISGSSGN